jgi:hypothetical protein
MLRGRFRAQPRPGATVEVRAPRARTNDDVTGGQRRAQRHRQGQQELVGNAVLEAHLIIRGAGGFQPWG